MVGKALRALVPAAVMLLVAVASGWPDIVRFWKIKQLSLRGGHPDNVPAPGRKAYLHSRDSGEADGTGDFDSASRGGPALVP